MLTSDSTGSDAGPVVRILASRSNAQRQVIAKTFGEIAQKVRRFARFDVTYTEESSDRIIRCAVRRCELCLLAHLLADQTQCGLVAKRRIATPLFGQGTEAVVKTISLCMLFFVAL